MICCLDQSPVWDTHYILGHVGYQIEAEEFLGLWLPSLRQVFLQIESYSPLYLVIIFVAHRVQGSPQAGVKAERVGMVWAEFVTTSIDSFPTSKLN